MKKTNDVPKALKSSLVQVNKDLRKNTQIDDEQSGTTCILVLIEGKTIYTANVGDSRAFMGEKDGEVVSLSHDQTPWRQVHPLTLSDLVTMPNLFSLCRAFLTRCCLCLWVGFVYARTSVNE